MLGEPFQAGYEYRTTGLNRPAISVYHAPIHDEKVGVHLYFRMGYTNSFREKNWPDHETASDKELTFKLTILIMLTTTLRVTAYKI